MRDSRDRPLLSVWHTVAVKRTRTRMQVLIYVRNHGNFIAHGTTGLSQMAPPTSLRDIRFVSLPDGWLVTETAPMWPLVLAAIITFVVLFTIRLRQIGLSYEGITSASLCALTGGLLGAWLVDGLLTANFSEPGFSSLGAAVGGPAALAAFAALRRVSPVSLLGAATPPALISVALARVGCLFAGCDFGRASSGSPWAIRYASESAALGFSQAASSQGQWLYVTPPLHPFPIYEAAPGFAAGLALWLLGARGASPRNVAVLGLGAYTAIRALSEWFRGGGAPTIVIAGVSLPVLSAGFAISTLALLIVASRTQPRAQLVSEPVSYQFRSPNTHKPEMLR